MAFLRRLGWYLVGLSIGIVFLVFFFRKKSGGTDAQFCYFPNCRVLKDMRSKPLVFANGLGQSYRDTLLIQSLLTDGDIDFRHSDTRSKPCKTYYIEKKINGKTNMFQFKNCQDTVVVESGSLIH